MLQYLSVILFVLGCCVYKTFEKKVCIGLQIVFQIRTSSTVFFWFFFRLNLRSLPCLSAACRLSYVSYGTPCVLLDCSPTRVKVVSPGSPNYLYDSCLRTDDISFRESKPYVGVMKDSSGYLLCQVRMLLCPQLFCMLSVEIPTSVFMKSSCRTKTALALVLFGTDRILIAMRAAR